MMLLGLRLLMLLIGIILFGCILFICWCNNFCSWWFCFWSFWVFFFVINYVVWIFVGFLVLWFELLLMFILGKIVIFLVMGLRIDKLFFDLFLFLLCNLIGKLWNVLLIWKCFLFIIFFGVIIEMGLEWGNLGSLVIGFMVCSLFLGWIMFFSCLFG